MRRPPTGRRPSSQAPKQYGPATGVAGSRAGMRHDRTEAAPEWRLSRTKRPHDPPPPRSPRRRRPLPMTGQARISQDDFIQVVPEAIPRALCAEIVSRIRASDALRPGQVGGGVYPELKHSRDISITGQAGWQDVEQVLNLAMLDALIHYLRAWPQPRPRRVRARGRSPARSPPSGRPIRNRSTTRSMACAGGLTWRRVRSRKSTMTPDQPHRRPHQQPRERRIRRALHCWRAGAGARRTCSDVSSRITPWKTSASSSGSTASAPAGTTDSTSSRPTVSVA